MAFGLRRAPVKHLLLSRASRKRGARTLWPPAGITIRMSKGAPGVRYAEVEREAAGLRVRVVLDLDGGTKRDSASGVPYFDRLLCLLALTGQVDLGVQVEGSHPEDDHHALVEVGIALGQAFRAALAESDPPQRVATATVPKEDALVLASVDVQARGALHTDLAFASRVVGGVATQSLLEFLRCFASQAGIALHVRKIAGENDHHVFEAVFKAIGLALCAATRVADRRNPSGKGTD